MISFGRISNQKCGLNMRSKRNQLGIASLRTHSVSTVIVRRSVMVMASDSGVMDKPKQAKKTTGSRGLSPKYNVMLHNDDVNRRDYVVKILVKVVDSIDAEKAMNIMQEAHETGVALVIWCGQEDAERYCEGLRKGGLVSTIHPV